MKRRSFFGSALVAFAGAPAALAAAAFPFTRRANAEPPEPKPPAKIPKPPREAFGGCWMRKEGVASWEEVVKMFVRKTNATPFLRQPPEALFCTDFGYDPEDGTVIAYFVLIGTAETHWHITRESLSPVDWGDGWEPTVIELSCFYPADSA